MIPTAITPAETKTLRQLARGRFVLEVGSLLGYSTVELAKVAAEVVAVDPHEGYPANDPRPTLGPFLKNLEDHRVRRKVLPIIGTDLDALPFLRRHFFDLVFIDMTGCYEDTLRVCNAAPYLMQPEGVLAVHDCGHPDWPGAKQACIDFAVEVGANFRVVDRLAVFDRYSLWREVSR